MEEGQCAAHRIPSILLILSKNLLLRTRLALSVVEMDYLMTPLSPDAIFITGWGHTADSLAGLRDALHMTGSATLLAPPDLDSDGLSTGSAKLLDRLQAHGEPTLIVGWSMGAIIALEAATRPPANLQALVLLAPTARFCADAAYRFGVRDLVLRRMIARLGSHPQETLREFLCNAAHPEPLTGALLADAVQAGLSIPVPILKRGLDYLRLTDLRDRLPHVRVPVLIIHGADDGIVPQGASETIAARLSTVTRAIIPGAGHMLPRFHLDTLRAHIIEFLAALP